MSQSIIANAHSVIIDESKLGSKHLAIRVYDVQKRQLLNLIINMDTTSPGLVMTIPPGPTPARPKTVVVTPPTVTVSDNSPVGTSLSTISVAMSDGSAFSGSLSIAANNMVGLSGGKAVLTRALATSDDGAHSCGITATQGGGSASATLNFTVAAAPVHTLVLSLSSLSAQIDDASPAGLVLSTATVKYSDGTVPASITLTSSDPSLVGINGAQLVLARALSAADDGVHHVTITASDGLGATVAMRLFEAGP